MRRMWIDIDLDALTENYQAVTALLTGGTRCMAVVKADAYGLGAGEVALALERAGCQAFAVTSVAEGLNLRHYGVDSMILVLGPSLEAEWEGAVQGGLILTLSSSDGIAELEKLGSRLGQEILVHIKLETGMGRTGFTPDQFPELAQSLKKSPHIIVQGIYTHFARAAQRDKAYTESQYERFRTGVEWLAGQGINPQYRHVCNSAAFLDYPQWHMDFVRVGTLLIGHYPQQSFASCLKLRDPWSARSTVLHVHEAPRGTFVGYQSIYRTKENTRLAVIPAGYADGFGVEPRLIPQGWVDLFKIMLKNTAALFGKTLGQEKIELRGRKVRVAGKIGMQLTVLDVGRDKCEVGDEVVIPLRRVQANPCILRRYWQRGKVISERNLQEDRMVLNHSYVED